MKQRLRAWLDAAQSGFMPRLQWLAGGLLHSIGWTGVTGVMLLGAGLAGLLYAALALEPKLDTDRLALEAAAQQAKARPAAPAEQRPAPSVRLDQFHASFPAPREIPAAIGTVLRIAGEQGLALDQGQYRLAAESGGPLMRYQMTLPVRGTYRQLRGFVEQSLLELPALALDGVQFRRETVGAAGIDSVVEFSLYVHQR